MAERKAFLIRIEKDVLEAIQRWASDDLRSVNAQVEFLLRRALQDSGRWRKTGDRRERGGTPRRDRDD